METIGNCQLRVRVMVRMVSRQRTDSHDEEGKVAGAARVGGSFTQRATVPHHLSHMACSIETRVHHKVILTFTTLCISNTHKTHAVAVNHRAPVGEGVGAPVGAPVGATARVRVSTTGRAATAA